MPSRLITKKYNKMYTALLLSWTVTLTGQLADSVLGGIFISEEAVSATGLVMPIISLVTFLSYLFGIGCSTKFSNYEGAFEPETASKAAGLGLLLAVISSGAIAVLMLLGENLYFRFYGAGSVVDGMAREYYRYMIPLACLYPIYFALYYLVLIDGDEKRMLYSDFSTAIGNTVFSLILVQHWGG